MSRLTWFEIHAADPARAMRFYGGLFDWTFDGFGDDYWLIRTGDPAKPGIDGGLMPRRGPTPAPGQPVNAYTCVVSVGDLDEAALFGLPGRTLTVGSLRLRPSRKPLRV